MTASEPHHCAYTLVVAGRVISVSTCHYGQTVNLPAPGLKPRNHWFRCTA